MSRFIFPETSPYLRGNFKPMRFEGIASFLEVEGELPDLAAPVLLVPESEEHDLRFRVNLGFRVNP